MTDSGFLAVEGGRLECARWGTTGSLEGPPLVLLHEGLGCVSMWRDWPAAVAEATGREVLAYSRFGYGGSSPAELPRPLDFMHREARRILPQVIERTGLVRPVLVGHSDGGTIALLCAAAGEVPLAGVVTLAAHAFNEPRCIAGIETARDSFLDGTLRERLARHHGERTDDAFRGWCDAWLDPRFERWSIEDELAGVDVPVLAVQGRDDAYGTLRQVEVIAKRIAGPCRTLVLDDCGHSPHRDRERETTEAIVRFVAEL
ncbi:MAG: alpha/beta hydrolase [Immundisolibacterales bacterium]|nr:alpha/beta hydrolase [Immundisolibacterales bacterium]